MSFRILIIDDSPAMRLAVQRAIDMSGLPVQSYLTAEHGKAALLLLEKNPIDLMLVDMNMPEMSGPDFIRHVQQQPESPRIPFIVISADATATRVQEMLEAGALAYLLKPFTAETLRLEMLKALEQIRRAN